MRVKMNYALSTSQDALLKMYLDSITKGIINNFGITPDVEYTIDTGLVVGHDKVDISKDTNRDTFDDKLDIEQEVIPTTGISTLLEMDNGQSKVIFVDSEIGLSFIPMYMNNTINLNIKYSSKSKSKVQRVVSKARENIKNYFRAFNVDYNYNYHLNYKLITLFEAIVNCKNDVLDKDIDLDTYVNTIKSSSVSFTSTQDITKRPSTLTINERSLNNRVNLNSTSADLKVLFNREDTTYYANFEFTAEAFIPEYINIIYPKIVYNKLLPKDFIFGRKKSDIKGEVNKYFKGDSHLFDKLIKELYTGAKHRHIVYPLEDNYILPYIEDSVTLMAQIVTTITNDDKRTLMNITEIPGLVFREDIIKYMKDNHQYLNKFLQSYFYIKLFADDTLLGDSMISIDENLNIIATEDLDITKLHRVTIGIINRVNMLSVEAKDRIVKDEKITGYIRNFYEMDNGIYYKENYKYKYIIEDDTTDIKLLPTQSYIVAVSNFFK